MAKFVLSPQAQKSLQQIRSYTLDNFGTQQTKLYLNAMRARMLHLAKYPLEGKSRDDIKVDYYSYFEGAHTIYYRICDTHIDVIDALQQSMEPNRHL